MPDKVVIGCCNTKQQSNQQVQDWNSGMLMFAQMSSKHSNNTKSEQLF